MSADTQQHRITATIATIPMISTTSIESLKDFYWIRKNSGRGEREEDQ